MKIVIIGCGKVGGRLAVQLVREGHDIVAIDNKAGVLSQLSRSEDLICIEGNAVEYAIQQEAGIEEADLVIACTDEDELNMLCCLISKKHGAKRTIARVRKPEYYEQIAFIGNDMGLSLVINPERAAADTIARVLIFPAAAGIEPFAKGMAELLEYEIAAGNRMIGKSLAQLNGQSSQTVLISAIKRGNDVFIPTGSDVLQEGDRIYLVSSHRAITSFLKRFHMLRSSVRTVMIVGASKIAYYLAKQLIRQDIKVKVIEPNAEKCLDFSNKFPSAIVINGDGSDQKLLDEEGIENVDAFVSLTGMDEMNVIMSLYAKMKNVGKIITKVTQINFGDIFKNIGIETTFSPKDITANIILRYVRAMSASGESEMESLITLIDGRLEALEFRLDRAGTYQGVPLKDLPIKDGCLIACIVRKSKVIIPGGMDHMEQGDTVVVVTSHQHIRDMHEIFNKG